MSFVLTRMFAYFTLFTYLVVGGMAVRLLMPEMTTVEVSSEYLSLFQKYEIQSTEVAPVTAPEMKFAEIKFPVEKKIATPAPKKAVVAKVIPTVEKMEKVARNELPFHEPVKLQAVVMDNELPENLVALYVDFKFEMVAETAPVSDEVSTRLAADVEPVFFDYSEETPVKKEVTKTVVEEVSETPEVINNVEEAKIVDKAEANIAVDELIAFDYSKASRDLKEQTVPTVSKMTTQKALGAGAPSMTASTAHPTTWTITKKSKKKPGVTTQSETNPYKKDDKGIVPPPQPPMPPKVYPNRVSIQLTGTDLKDVVNEVGFEVRFQDDLNETYQDYNDGTVTIDQDLSRPRMTRSMVVLKRGYTPTNTDLILEEGVTETIMPVIDEQTFNELLGPYGSRGPIGAVLVELDENVEGASLDVPYSKVLRLDGDMKVTEDEVFAYELFIGVKAGNALLSYKSQRGEITSKIIHVHEHELTFETNFFENVADDKVELFEEDLLAKEKTPLIISSQEVRQFATDKTAKKINDHTYKMNFNKTLLGGRKYLELNHHSEPIFVGFKNSNVLDIPSENFMRYILSRFEGSKLGNRCLVQLNIRKKAVKFDVSPESVGQSLVTYTQVLDSDGKFYDSIGAKSRKLIVVGENQGAPGLSQDAKINVKITYIDGSVQFVGSYCSPNTYLVEQL